MHPPLLGWPETLSRFEATHAIKKSKVLLRRAPRGTPLAALRAAVLVAAAVRKWERGLAPRPFGADGAGVLLYEGFRRLDPAHLLVDLGDPEPVVVHAPERPDFFERAVRLLRDHAPGPWTADVLFESTVGAEVHVVQRAA